MTKKTYHKLTSFLLCLLMLLAAFTPAVAALDNIDASIGIGGDHMTWPKNGGGIIIELIHKHLELGGE